MSRYSNIMKIINDKKIRLGTSSIADYVESDSDILLIATEGDRCDLLSQQYYGTPEFWWFIASVNKLSTNNIPVGKQLRIPVSTNEAVMT
tara:strand:- start:2278 stop:2547 length:270 start_codon:yes stop_codon:yes gene_type:complete